MQQHNEEIPAKIDRLSKEDCNKDVTLMNGLSSPNEEFIILSENQLIEELSESIKNGNNGNTKNARNYSKEMKEKYVVNCRGGSIDV